MLRLSAVFFSHCSATIPVIWELTKNYNYGLNSQLSVQRGREQPERLELLLASRLFLSNLGRERKKKQQQKLAKWEPPSRSPPTTTALVVTAAALLVVAVLVLVK